MNSWIESLSKSWYTQPALPPTPSGDIDDNWEIIETSNHNVFPNFHVVDDVPIGFFSLLTKRHLDEFLDQNRHRLACYWQTKSKDPNPKWKGALKYIPYTNLPPGWHMLDVLEAKDGGFRENLNQILNVELDRLRYLELRFPYAISLEFQSNLFRGLFLWRPFVSYLWGEICSNPWAQFTIAYPLEHLYGDDGVQHPWEESVECMIGILLNRPHSYPRIFVNLIGPRNSPLESELERKICQEQAIRLAAIHGGHLGSNYFVSVLSNSAETTAGISQESGGGKPIPKIEP